MTTNETIESLKEYAIKNSIYINDSEVLNKVIDSAYNAKLMDLDDYFTTLIMINQLIIHIMVSLGWILK